MNDQEKAPGSEEKNPAVNLEENSLNKECVLKKENDSSDCLKKALEKLMSSVVSDLAEPAEMISPDISAIEVIKLLEKNRPLLVSKKYEVTGMITPLSLLKYIPKGNLNSLTADDLKEPLAQIDAEKNISQAIELMDLSHHEYLALSSKDTIFGIITSLEIIKSLGKALSGDSYAPEEMIETKIDEFLNLLKKGPVSIIEAKSKLGVSEDQIEAWMAVLENQKIIRLEKHFGKITIKNERKI
jgi:predicted transcriptional regulator